MTRPPSRAHMLRVLRRAILPLLCVPCALRAQSGTAPAVGARVKVETTGGSVVTGDVSAVGGDSLVLLIGRDMNRFRLRSRDVQGVAVSLGKAHGKGALWGAAIGGALGVALVTASLQEDRNSDATIPSTLFVAPGAILLTGIAAGIGALAAPEKWSDMRPMRVGVVPAGRAGVGVGVAVRF